MPRLDIRLEARSPLLLGRGSALDNVQESRTVVPGSSWRGAVAALILDGLGLNGQPIPPDSPFARLFLVGEPARFGCLYPVRCHAEAVVGSPLPAPLTARTCKLDPGFAPAHGGVYDGLLARLHEAAHGLAPYALAPALCPHCGQRLERLRGTVATTGGYHRVEVGSQSFVRVGLNRYTESAQEGILYVLDALVPGAGGPGQEPPLTFVGTWQGSEAQLQDLRALLAAHAIPDGAGYTLFVGSARARGMGRATLHLADARLPAPLPERLEAFQPSGAHPHVYATLALRGPLLLRDERGLPALPPTIESLRAYDPAPPPSLELLTAYSSLAVERGTGWSTAWGLPKGTTPALAAGSVLVVRASACERSDLEGWLAHLEESGLGERQAEGWGEVVACDDFHVALADGGSREGRET